MNPRSNNPFGSFEEMFEQMTRQLDEMNRGLESWGDLGDFGDLGAPAVAVDVAEHDDEIVVAADLPGFERDDIDVSVSERTLTIAASHDAESEHDSSDGGDGTYVRRERRHRSLHRSVVLPADVDESGASASYTNGVLTVTLLTVAEDDDPRHIDVN